MPVLTFGSLFAGIGGFDLGFERAGMKCVWQVEIDEFCQRVLAKHWPDVRRHDDVRTFPPAGDWYADVICGGFPCQPVSAAGKKKAQADARWLWPEMSRIVRDLRPRFAVVENVAGLLDRGIGDVLRDLAAIGYDAEWDCIPAATFGTPHLRGRIFLVAYPASAGPQGQKSASRIWGRGLLTQRDWWPAEPALARLGHGVPDRVAGTVAMGNAVVPQIAEWIGRRLMESAHADA